MPWKPSARQACMQFQHGVVDERIGLGALELLEEAHAAGALAEEAAQHAVLRPDMPVLGRDVLHDVVGRGAEDVFGDVAPGPRACRRRGCPARRL